MRSRNVVGPVVALALAACTYGPEEQRVRIEQIVSFEDSYLALITIRYDRLRPPTGLSAFPDGGKALVLERRARQYVVDGQERTARLLLDRQAPDELWESFEMWVAALEGDSAAYVRLSGCPRGGECWGELRRHSVLRATLVGDVRPVSDVPEGLGLPGTMLARRQGEERFIRWSTAGDTVTARRVEGGAFDPLFLAASDGTLAPIRP